MYDVIVIGGGPTGSTAASLLAEKGHKVLVLEKEKFPREHVGESLIPLTYKGIERLGLMDGLKKIATRKPGVSFVSADGKHQSLWCFKNVIKDKSYLSFHVIRSAFDKLLLDNSRLLGAEVQEETQVKDVKLDMPDGSAEVTAATATGETKTYRCKFLIDASGQSTFLGKKLGVKRSYEGLDRVAIFNHWTGAHFDKPLQQGAIKIVYMGGDKKGWVWVIPVSAEHLSIGIVVNNSYVKQEKAKFQAQGSVDWEKDLYMQEIFDSKVLSEILKDAKTEHKMLLIGDYSYHCEKKYGDNYALLGDAGAFLDPIFSSGIYVGMHSSELVSEAIHVKLSKGDGKAEMEKVFAQINGAVKLLEKFIRLFYTPESLNFSMMGNPQDQLYSKFEMAYTIFHYLLAGDFFENHEKYSQFIDMVRDQKTLVKFQSLIKHKKDDSADGDCGETFEEMYGEMKHEIVFDKSIL